jgi:hypothetical protein
MIIIDLAHEKGAGPTTIARHLIAEGADPEENLRVMRGETQCFYDYRLSKWAGLMVVEGADHEPRFVKYREPPSSKRELVR